MPSFKVTEFKRIPVRELHPQYGYQFAPATCKLIWIVTCNRICPPNWQNEPQDRSMRIDLSFYRKWITSLTCVHGK